MSPKLHVIRQFPFLHYEIELSKPIKMKNDPVCSLFYYPCTACTGGGVTLTGAGSGVVSSPGFPGNFPQNSLCIWNITVPSGRIKLTFLNFTLEPGEKPCRQGGQGARLKITNVASNDNENPFALCGPLTPGQLPAPVYSIANYLGLQLSTLNNVYSGFKATYETVTDDMCKLQCP